MLQVASALKGYAIEAKDGTLGTVSDFLFDDRTWKVRWLVVDTGSWLSGRKVLVHPSAVEGTDHVSRQLTVALTTEQVRNSPDILQDRPVSQQMETNLYGYYGWSPLWGDSYFGGGAIASPLAGAPYFGGVGMPGAESEGLLLEDGDPHLRSMASVTGYHVQATDGDIGHVENFVIEDGSWGVRYLIIDTSNWWFGQHVLLSPYAVREVDWMSSHIRLDTTRARIKASPPWNPAEIIDRAFERRLHSHYDWPGYGW